MSADELVDIVDENSNFIKVVPKKEAHTLGLLHKTVTNAVITKDGRYLMTKPASDRQDPGQYVFPSGGHVSAGESEDDALKREVFEELGLKDFDYEFVGKAIFNREVLGRQENHFFYVYKVFSDQEPKLSHEHESFKYFTEDELKKELKEHPENFGGSFHFTANKFFKNLL
jgi:isopentenyl-diphosphate delta-isomerase